MRLLKTLHMQNNFLRVIEKAFDFGLVGILIALCVGAGAVGFQKFREYLLENRDPLAVGDIFPLSGVKFSEARRTLVLAISPKCRYCLMSREFLRTLYQSAREKRIPVVLVMPTHVLGSEYRAVLQMHEATLRQVDLRSVGIYGTPTILLVDSQAVVRQQWVGKMPPDMERDIVATLGSELLDGNDRMPVQAEISGAGLSKLRTTTCPILLDPRNREDFAQIHARDAVNIPYDELEMRLHAEIPKASTIVVDCTRFPSLACNFVAKRLEEYGYLEVALLNKGSFATPRCRE